MQHQSGKSGLGCFHMGSLQHIESEMPWFGAIGMVEELFMAILKDGGVGFLHY